MPSQVLRSLGTAAAFGVTMAPELSATAVVASAENAFLLVNMFPSKLVLTDRTVVYFSVIESRETDESAIVIVLPSWRGGGAVWL